MSTPGRGGYDRVMAQIAAAARECGRDPAAIELVAVTKTFPPEAIVPVLEAGQRVFGENRVQEAKAKWPTRDEVHDMLIEHMDEPEAGKILDRLFPQEQEPKQ